MRGLPGVIAVVVAVTSGCSANWIEHVPKKPQPGERIRCTQSRSAPIFDSILTAAASAVLIGSGVAMGKKCGPLDECVGPFVLSFAGIVTSAVLMAAFGASAAYGFVHTARCRARATGAAAP
jgi:hypothetical protein